MGACTSRDCKLPCKKPNMADPWNKVKTYEDLIDANVAFIRNTDEVACSPYHFAPLEPDSRALVENLVTLHTKYKLVTVNGQSSACDKYSRQKAYVCFYIEKNVASEALIKRMVESDKMVVYAFDNETKKSFSTEGATSPYVVTEDKDTHGWSAYTSIDIDEDNLENDWQGFANIQGLLKNSFYVCAAHKKWCEGDIETTLLTILESNARATRTTRTGGRASKLESLTVKELQERCGKRKIKVSGLRKAALIAALRKQG